jgi:hypothetical protein
MVVSSFYRFEVFQEVAMEITAKPLTLGFNYIFMLLTASV